MCVHTKKEWQLYLQKIVSAAGPYGWMKMQDDIYCTSLDGWTVHRQTIKLVKGRLGRSRLYQWTHCGMTNEWASIINCHHGINGWYTGRSYELALSDTSELVSCGTKESVCLKRVDDHKIESEIVNLVTLWNQQLNESELCLLQCYLKFHD